MSEQNSYAFECEGIVKSFAKNHVLKKVDLKIIRGSVHALVGANGAGKSTLVKIITGVYNSDSGVMMIDGQKVEINNPVDAENHGIAIIHQDQQLVPLFSVTQNIFLGSEKKNRLGFLDYKSMRASAQGALEIVGADFSPDAQIEDLTVSQRELVAIAAALHRQPRMIIFDEPTASLSSREIQKLFEIIRMLKERGITVVYISHHLDEVYEICDRITVLRDGTNIATVDTAASTHDEIISHMIGRSIERLFPKKQIPIGDVMFEVKGLKQGKLVSNVSFTVRRGEILGIAGLVGAGRTESMLSVYGAQKAGAGSFTLNGKVFHPVSPSDSIARKIAFIPEDRRNDGIIAKLSIAENIMLANISKNAKFGIVNPKKDEEAIGRIINDLHVVCTGSEQPVTELSGGNQQKIVIGRWLVSDVDLFIMDHPTVGVDVGAKVEIYNQMTKMAEKGAGVLFISSENDELLGMCDRILVMSKGEIVKEFSRDEASDHELLRYSTSVAE